MIFETFLLSPIGLMRYLQFQQLPTSSTNLQFTVTLHYTTLHYTALHITSLHYTTLHTVLLHLQYKMKFHHSHSHSHSHSQVRFLGLMVILNLRNYPFLHDHIVHDLFDSLLKIMMIKVMLQKMICK